MASNYGSISQQQNKTENCEDRDSSLYSFNNKKRVLVIAGIIAISVYAIQVRVCLPSESEFSKSLTIVFVWILTHFSFPDFFVSFLGHSWFWIETFLVPTHCTNQYF